jgi:FkbM family methyltransferase
MPNKILNKTIFQKKYGRPNLIKKIRQWAIEYLAMPLSLEHLSQNRKQLVVFSFDYIALRINIDGVYELEELETFFSWISKFRDKVFDGVALDIGANIGNHSLYFSDYFKKVFSFEPIPMTFKILSLNSELAENITCFNVGVSDCEKISFMDIFPSNMGGARITNTSPNYCKTINLKTLDSLINPLEDIKLIKIDVEGHEYEVLVGAEKIIKKNNPIILFEQHKSDFIDGKSRVINLIKSFGYSHFLTIQKVPKGSSGLNTTSRLLYAAITRFIFGSAMQINKQVEFEPDFYPFIVAMPQWLDFHSDAYSDSALH